MDTVDKATRNRIMRSIKGAGTALEARMYREAILPAIAEFKAENPSNGGRFGLFNWGFGNGMLESQRADLPGKPDFVVANKVAIFVDGCFWHAHKACGADLKRPKANWRFWKAKLQGNRRRDARKTRELRVRGFSVVRLHECEKSVVLAKRMVRAFENRFGKKSIERLVGIR